MFQLAWPLLKHHLINEYFQKKVFDIGSGYPRPCRLIGSFLSQYSGNYSSKNGLQCSQRTHFNALSCQTSLFSLLLLLPLTDRLFSISLSLSLDTEQPIPLSNKLGQSGFNNNVSHSKMYIPNSLWSSYDYECSCVPFFVFPLFCCLAVSSEEIFLVQDQTLPCV